MSAIKHHGSWAVRLVIGGQRIFRSLGPSATKADAIAYEAKIRRDHIERRLGKTPPRSLEDALARWLEGEAAQLKDRRGMIDKVRALRPHCAGLALDQIVQAAEAVKAAGIRAQLKPATINRRLAILRRVANLAFSAWEWLDQPLGQRIKLLRGETPRLITLTVAQAEHFLDCMPARTRAAVILYLSTGMRVGELLKLDPRKHLIENMIVLDADNKTERPRIIPMGEETAQLVAVWKPGEITYSKLRHDIEEARVRAEMPWLQTRDLRRTFGSWIVQRTKSLKLAQDLLGHTTPTITAKHYAFMLNADLAAAVDTLPTFGPGKEVAPELHQDSE